jgi:RimJ/RimL family protein N-acetyltransferase
MQVTIDWAKEQGMRRVEFWSDTQYLRAHRFFEKSGFTITERVREMHDGLQPFRERFCFRDLD